MFFGSCNSPLRQVASSCNIRFMNGLRWLLMFQHQRDIISRYTMSHQRRDALWQKSLHCHRNVMTITESKHALFHAVNLSANIAVRSRATSVTASSVEFFVNVYFVTTKPRKETSKNRFADSKCLEQSLYRLYAVRTVSCHAVCSFPTLAATCHTR